MQALAETKLAVDRWLRDDFNTPNAMRAVLSLVSLTNKYLYEDATLTSPLAQSSQISNKLHGTNSSLDSKRNLSTTEIGSLNSDYRKDDASKLSIENIDGSKDEVPLTASDNGTSTDGSNVASVGYEEIATVRHYVLTFMKMLGMRYKSSKVRRLHLR